MRQKPNLSFLFLADIACKTGIIFSQTSFILFSSFYLQDSRKQDRDSLVLKPRHTKSFGIGQRYLPFWIAPYEALPVPHQDASAPLSPQESKAVYDLRSGFLRFAFQSLGFFPEYWALAVHFHRYSESDSPDSAAHPAQSVFPDPAASLRDRPVLQAGIGFGGFPPPPPPPWLLTLY